MHIETFMKMTSEKKAKSMYVKSRAFTPTPVGFCNSITIGSFGSMLVIASNGSEPYKKNGSTGVKRL